MGYEWGWRRIKGEKSTGNGENHGKPHGKTLKLVEKHGKSVKPLGKNEIGKHMSAPMETLQSVLNKSADRTASAFHFLRKESRSTLIERSILHVIIRYETPLIN